MAVGNRMRIVVNPNADKLVGEALDELLGRLGENIVENAQRTVPYRTGDLHDSLAYEAGDGVLIVGVDEGLYGVDYGSYVELGTSRQAAQPYLVPAVLQAKGSIK